MAMGRTFTRIAILWCVVIPLAGCFGSTSAPSRSSTSPQPERGSQSGQGAGGQSVDPAQAQRLQRLMLPLLAVMDHPLSLRDVRVSVVNDPQINAGSAGSGQFIVTSGLLQRANDAQLQSVLAHEIAHDDLRHVAKAQSMGVGLSIASVLLDQFFPGSGYFTPLAGNLLVRAYGRDEEYAADMHGVELLRRSNHPNGKEMMIDSLTWLMQSTGGSGGGFFATHPGTSDRIDKLRSMP
jgi:Zn-dependent protease with chaperone function